jgi:hypothetical protein
MNEHALAPLIRYANEMSHVEEGWIQPLGEVVRDIDAGCAAWKPAPEVASIWEILAHAAPYLESRVCDFTGRRYPDEEDWPPVSDTSPEAWAAMQNRIASAIGQLSEALALVSDDQLSQIPEGKQTALASRLLDIFVHDAYHAGQIVKLTQLYRSRK